AAPTTQAIPPCGHGSQPSAWRMPCRRDTARADVGLDRCGVLGTGYCRDVRHASTDHGREESVMSLRQSLQAWSTARRARQLTCCRCISMGCLLLLLGMVGMGLWEASQTEHTPALRWMQGYRNAEVVGCCSEQDCVPWPVALLQMTQDEATVRIGDAVIHLPSRSVHATQDGQSYWCCQTD